MIIITNYNTDKPAMIVHCAHEDLIKLRRVINIPLSARYPESIQGDRVVTSPMPTHWIGEPSALKFVRQWADDSGFTVTDL